MAEENATSVQGRSRKTDAELVKEFWSEVGFPGPSSLLWEKGESTGGAVKGVPCLSEGKESSSPAGIPQAKEGEQSIGSVSPEKGRSRGFKIRPWRGPL